MHGDRSTAPALNTVAVSRACAGERRIVKYSFVCSMRRSLARRVGRAGRHVSPRERFPTNPSRTRPMANTAPIPIAESADLKKGRAWFGSGNVQRCVLLRGVS